MAAGNIAPQCPAHCRYIYAGVREKTFVFKGCDAVYKMGGYVWVGRKAPLSVCCNGCIEQVAPGVFDYIAGGGCKKLAGKGNVKEQEGKYPCCECCFLFGAKRF